MGDVVDEVNLLILRDRGTGEQGETEKRGIGEPENRGNGAPSRTGETENRGIPVMGDVVDEVDILRIHHPRRS